MARFFSLEAAELLDELIGQGHEIESVEGGLRVLPRPSRDLAARIEQNLEGLVRLVDAGEGRWRPDWSGEVKLVVLHRGDGSKEQWAVVTRDDRPAWKRSWRVQNSGVAKPESGDSQRV